MAPVIESAKTPLLYATNYEGGNCSRYVFSFSTVPNQELAQLLPYMNRTFGNTYFLLGADRAWPHKMFEAAEPIIRKLGGRVVGTEYTTGKETDFAPLIRRIAATKAKVLLFALKGDGLNFIPQADDLGLLKTTTVAFLGLSETDLGIFDGKGQNMFVVVPFVATSGAPPAKAFVTKVKADAGADATVSNYVMTHYVAAEAEADALAAHVGDDVGARAGRASPARRQLEGEEMAARGPLRTGVTSRASQSGRTWRARSRQEQLLQRQHVLVDRLDGQPDLVHPVEHGGQPVEPGRIERRAHEARAVGAVGDGPPPLPVSAPNAANQPVSRGRGASPAGNA